MLNPLAITGELYKVFDTVQHSESFQSRTFILKDDSNPAYPQFIQMQLTQLKCELISKLTQGARITVSFNVRGKEYPDKETAEIKYITTLEAWRITLA